MTDNNYTDRLIGSETVNIDQLQFHEDNPKIHPQSQTQALKGAMRELGMMARPKVNLRTSELWGEKQHEQVLLDGHARIKAMAQDGVNETVVDYYDLTPNEEKAFLLSFDPIGAMFVAERNATERLLEEVNVGDEDLMSFLAEQAEAVLGLYDADGELDAPDFQEYDVDIANDVKMVCCPHCNKEFPL